jgi:hypothetical protein
MHLITCDHSTIAKQRSSNELINERKAKGYGFQNKIFEAWATRISRKWGWNDELKLATHYYYTKQLALIVHVKVSTK